MAIRLINYPDYFAKLLSLGNRRAVDDVCLCKSSHRLCSEELDYIFAPLVTHLFLYSLVFITSRLWSLLLDFQPICNATSNVSREICVLNSLRLIIRHTTEVKIL